MSLHLVESANEFYIRSDNFVSKGLQTMVIDRRNTHITVTSGDSVIGASLQVTSGAIFGIIGIMNVLGTNYLGIIDNAEHVGTLNNAKIYKITDVSMVPFQLSTTGH